MANIKLLCKLLFHCCLYFHIHIKNDNSLWIFAAQLLLLDLFIGIDLSHCQ